MMVDNLGKNMMLDTWDNKIFMPRFYDCDTICSYDNSGQLKFDVDIEMAQGYWNTSSSRLWTRIRDLMHDELVAKYNNMRQNGLSYESLMECFYDEQIAKIPQKYYNMDYDVKYAPFADSYIGMANGDVYEHVKRWLQQRIRFVDTLYDYAPSYNNDVLTIRANTTELMTLEIETYTPVYQHLSWYNNQMDKKKIDGKTSVTFTGTAMAATDQEVLIYGGSNIKSIKGISSMNPNRMLIGSATKLITLEAPNCPLLADINANKANLAPHLYLNKVDLSGCPLLGGNLIVNQSPLVREIDIRGTAITGLNLPPSLRNLEVLKLPAAIPNLVLNDAGQLHTLEFEEGVKLQSVSMTNCNALVNTTNFNLEDATSIALNNSYNSVDELYFSKATNLSLSNMLNLERVIYTPNAEHETFDKANVDNASNYTISTFNCPKLNEFITTAPYRNSYNKDYGEKKPNEVFEANVLDISSTQFKDVKLLCTTDTNKLLLPRTINNLIIDSAYDLDTELLTDGDYNTIHTDLYEAYNTDYEESVKINDETPDIIPSASDGSLIFSMYAPHNTTEPASGTWDLKGLEIDTLHTFGLNNDVKQSYDMILEGKNLDWSFSWGVLDITTILNDGFTSITPLSGSNHTISCYDKDGTSVARYTAAKVNTEYSIPENTYRIDIECYSSEVEKVSYKVAMFQIQMPNRTDDYTYKIDNLTLSDEVMRYTATTTNAFPTFNTDFEYSYIVEPKEGEYLYRIIADNDTVMTSINCENTNIQQYITSVEYLDSSNLKSFCRAFYGCRNLINVNAYGWDTSNVTDMSYMFYGCHALTFLDVSSFNTSNVTKMEHMFHECTILTPLDVSSFNTSNVENMNSMFSGCGALTSLDLSNFNTSNVKNMANMFYSCRVLTSLDLSNFNTSNVTTLNAMFRNCNALSSLDLSNFNTSNVTDMSHMFNSCVQLESLDVSNFVTSKVTSMSGMFNNCSALTSLDVSGWDTQSLTTMGSMFTSCKALTSLDLSNFNTSKVTSMGSIFQACSNLISLDLSNWDTSKVTNVERMFSSCSSLQELIIYNWPLTTTNQTAINTLPDGNDAKNDIYATVYFTVPSGWSIISPLDFLIYTTNASGVEPTFNNEFTGYSINETDNGDGTYRVKIATDDLSNLPTSISFSGKANLLTVEKINTSNVTNMSSMFYGCSALTSLDVTNFDTSKVTDMGHMFRECKNLTSLDVSNFDTSNVTNMTYMFQYCSVLTSLDLSNFNTSKVTNMSYMFSRCSALTSLDVSNFDTSKVTTMIYMFYKCNALTSLDLSNFDISSVMYMGSMFSTCDALMSLNVMGWPLTDVTQTAISSLPIGNDAKNEIYATVYFSIPSGWEIINSLDFLVYTTNATGVVPTFNTGFTGYSINETDNGDGTYRVKIATDDLSNLPTSISFEGKTNLLTVEKINTSNVTDMYSMFYNCSKLTSLNVSKFNTSKVTNMRSMFYNCSALASLDLSNFDTSNVTTMNSMFYNCSNLASLDISNFDTTNVNNMGYMFYNCSNLASLDLSNFDTSNVSNMTYMFYNCSKLISLDVSNFNTTNVTNMCGIFESCNKLASLDLSNFNTTNVTTMNSMFSGCTALASLDLSNFDTSKVMDTSYMFQYCYALTSLDVSGWPNNTHTQTAISSLPVGNDAKNEIYASSPFTVPSGWVLIYDNPYDIVVYTSSASGVIPSFNTEYTEYSTEETDNGDGTYTTYIKTNDLDVLPTEISFQDNVNLLTVENIKIGEMTNMSYMFSGCTALTSLNLSSFDTSNVTDMRYMFYKCNNLASLDLSNFDTSNVTNMSYMFNACKTLASLDLSNFNTSNVADMNSMFYNCIALTSLNVSSFNTSNVTDMYSMFRNCNILTSLDVSNFDTTKVTKMDSMFRNCATLTSLNLSNFNTSNVTDMDYMFTGCSGLTSLDLSNFDASKVASMTAMFQSCNALKTLTANNMIHKNPKLFTNVINNGIIIELIAKNWKFDGENVSLNELFKGNTKLQKLDIESIDTTNVTNMASMFYSCTALTSLDISSFNTTNVTDMNGMFYDCNKLTSLDISSFNTTNVTDMNSMFYNCSKLESLNVTNFNTTNVTDMNGMFYDCNALTSLDLSNFNTTNVTDMSYMFNGCNALTSLDLSNFNTTNVTDMSYMFRNCNVLTSLGLSNFDTTNVENMGYMFGYCNVLTSLDLSNFDTTKVTSMSYMFRNCSALTSLDVSNFDTTNVENMAYMFDGCAALTSLDLSNWDTSSVTNMASMFQNCSNIIDIEPFNNVKVTHNISSMVKLSREEIVQWLNALSTVTTSVTITIDTTLLAKLLETDILIAVNKGWDVV